MEKLTAFGISTNDTTCLAVPQYITCINAVSRGLSCARLNGVDLSRWRSVITHMSAGLGGVGDLKAKRRLGEFDSRRRTFCTADSPS